MGGFPEEEFRKATLASRIDYRDPFDSALALIEAMHLTNGVRDLHYWGGEFLKWNGAAYQVLPMNDLRETLYALGRPIPVKKKHVDDVVDALRARANLSDTKSAPAWLDDDDGPPTTEIVPMANGLLHAPTRVLYSPTPSYFCLHAVPIAYQKGAPRPLSWLAFLSDLFGDDEDAIRLLQEWFGYCLLSRFEQHKALMLIGPKRSGKGTIIRVLIALLGRHNIVSPGLSSLASAFGLSCLIGKSVAFFPDAKLSSRADMATIAENLLMLTGEDYITIERKYREAFTSPPFVKLMFAANGLPAFTDASSALPSRFLILRLVHSFYGKEDHGLDAKLMLELPSIFNWALDGLDSLNERGRFSPPATSTELVEELDQLSAPVRTFIGDTYEIDPTGQIPVRDVYSAWCAWCRERGRDRPGSEQLFGRDLHAAFPHIRTQRPRIDGKPVRHYTGLRLILDDPR